MTAFQASPLLSVISDLARDMAPSQRFQQLLATIRQVLPCDAAALLQLRGTELIPLAVDGLSTDTLGRHFVTDDHPRLARILLSHEPVRFAADSPLPDPYDGLLHAVEGDLHVHDCLGIALYLQGVPWGVLTLDALNANAFDQIDPAELRYLARLSEAVIRVAELTNQLQSRTEHHQAMTQALVADGQQQLIGSSRAMQQLQQEIEMVAHSDLAVLITGETGVGKELVARQVHGLSNRARAPLIYLNCAALPENLVESELFGHTRGAFSGAVQSRVGKFELAHGGTLFLDEVGELPLTVQPKLLRALQSGEVQRVGSDSHHQVDVRIIAASNRDLHREVAEGRFRADLYHRLGVYPIAVPSLRERNKDVLLLAGHFLEQNRRRIGLRGLRLDASAREALLAYSWPGNVRELEHLISRAVLKAQAGQDGNRRLLTIRAELLALGGPQSDIPQQTLAATVNTTLPLAQSLRDATEHFQVQLIRQVLEKHHNNQSRAARELGVDRGNFSRLVRRLGI
ncbi:nitric oxide reductase transcriptional regulator NorR [Halopseudomonas bauzanensis]|uniref:Nitric oxide reductase transcriptional regulator NorR n=1 Tax=Halopseudomonas bauzanensis TaxID=653930 RepID=A0A4U0YIC9_9GAMM|nr:nitric oxide reductase transcriptional regulator NorR [Halopseudomonas bauzanensis]TKA90965.1 nitric oxide reductase transcriptional regulator NorR [Halopseudomonas bauzanensis]